MNDLISTSFKKKKTKMWCAFWKPTKHWFFFFILKTSKEVVQEWKICATFFRIHMCPRTMDFASHFECKPCFVSAHFFPSRCVGVFILSISCTPVMNTSGRKCLPLALLRLLFFFNLNTVWLAWVSPPLE